MWRPAFIRASCAALALALGGCGAVGPDRPESEATLLLDTAPNAVHAGVYLAVDRGYDEAEGVELAVRRPRASTDAVALLQAGRVEFAVLDVRDLAVARERGADVVGVMAVVGRPLAAVLAAPGVDSPADLEGRRVGVVDPATDGALLRSVVRAAGGDPDRVRRVAVGRRAVRALLSGRVDAVTGSWNVEGVELRRRRPSVREFRVDRFGAPVYPGLVVAVTRTRLEDRRDEVAATVRALQRGYGEALADPESALEAMARRLGRLDRASLAAQFDAVAPAFRAGAPVFGRLDAGRLRAWARWAASTGVLDAVPDVARAFDTTLVGPASRD